jgi:ABC-type transport system involved in multi-copper enzyme maturation permease subunit
MVALLQIELLKILRRRAFWVSIGLMLLIMLPLLYAAFGRGGVLIVNGQRVASIALPQGWAMLLEFQGLDMGQMSRIFLPVLLAILVGSEFVFKTSRQNIIDGLTRENFFFAKVVSVLILVGTFFAIYLLLGLIFGFALVPAAERGAAFIRASDAQMMGGFVTMMMGYGLLAMLFAVAARNTGTAMGLFFFYLIVVEQLVPQLLMLKESLQPLGRALKYLPASIFQELAKPARYDAEFVLSKLQQMAPPPQMAIPTDVAWYCALGYIALLGAASYLILKKTDL